MALGNNPTQQEVVTEVKRLETDKLNAANPSGTGSLSINRKPNTTIGSESVAVGYHNTASGMWSFAEGNGTSATAHATHAEGGDTHATQYAAHAEGSETTASGEAAHAEGSETIASGANSHAEGTGTIASRWAQHTFGRFNIEDTTGQDGDSAGEFVEIVGNGTRNARSNARTLDWSGNEMLAGNIKLGGHTTLTNQSNSDITVNLPSSA